MAYQYKLVVFLLTFESFNSIATACVQHGYQIRSAKADNRPACRKNENTIGTDAAIFIDTEEPANDCAKFLNTIFDSIAIFGAVLLCETNNPHQGTILFPCNIKRQTDQGPYRTPGE